MKKRKGQANLGITVATTAIVLVVLVLVLSQLVTTGTSSTSSSTVATAALNNVTKYLWTGVTLTSLGLVIVAGLGIVGILVARR